MTLQPGCRFVVAPRFHLPADWPRRLLVGAGVDQTDGGFIPRPSWRSLTTDELAVLVPTSAEPAPLEELGSCICLFNLPRHLRAAWWNLLEQAAPVLGDGRVPGLEAFVSQVVDFLAFKDLAVPEGARCDVVVNKPGQPFDCHLEAEFPLGLPCNPASRSGTEEPGRRRLWGGINLGDEPTSIVLINLSCRQLEAELRCRSPDQAPLTAVGDLVEQFLRSCPDYPTVRLILGPGEGYRLPRDGLVLVGHLGDKQEPDVLLLISQEMPHSR
jgi:hypothetical protein